MALFDKNNKFECIEEHADNAHPFENVHNHKCAVCNYLIKKDDETVYPTHTEQGVKYYTIYSKILKGFVCDPCIPYIPKPAICRACEESFPSKGSLFKHLNKHPDHNVCWM